MTGTSIHLIVRRIINATPQRLFEAWTTAEQLTKWWGPQGMSCPVAEVDLRVGGRYRIANVSASGDTTWISGEFESITPPKELVYTWSVEPATMPPERVTVRFEARDGKTEVIVIHERIVSDAARDQHNRGWQGCLAGLARLCDVSSESS